MARIQILPLPPCTIGDVTGQPFALVIDQAEDLGGDVTEMQANLKDFREACGAAGVLVVDGRLDVAQCPPADRTISFRPAEDSGLVERLWKHIRPDFGGDAQAVSA